MLQQILAVLLVLALLGWALWLLRRKGAARINIGLTRRVSGARRLEIVDRIALTAHHSLHLVRVEDRTILISVSPSGCTQLGAARYAQPLGAEAPRGLKPAPQSVLSEDAGD